MTTTFLLMPLVGEEVFGPVLCILPLDTEEEAVALAKDTDFIRTLAALQAVDAVGF